MMDGFKIYEGKRVYLILESKRYYTGIVKNVGSDFLIIIDKFGNTVTVKINDISSIEEQQLNNDGRKNGGNTRSI